MTNASTSAATAPLSLDGARAQLAHALESRQNVAVVHGFPSVLLWTEESVPVADTIGQLAIDRAQGTPRGIKLYLGTPYCPKTDPVKCGYCLFPVEDYTGMKDLTEYIGYLQREAALYQPLVEGLEVSNVFFGGGTANLYRADVYGVEMDMVRSLFRIAPDADVTLEGLPALYTREKLLAVKAAGFNRISMGAQQMNDELNQLSGRRQTARHVIQAIEWSHELGLGCNVDLIFGWPRQTVATMVKDLETLIATGVDDITHYELHIGGPTDFAINRRHELPTTLQNLEMYRVSRDLLVAAGFEQLTMYNWRRKGYQTSYVEGAEHDFGGLRGLGLGYAALSSFVWTDPARDSWFYKNATSVASYKQAIDEGRFPVERGFRAEAIDGRLALLFRHLHAMCIHRPSYRATFGLDVREEFAPIWDALEERELVASDPDHIRVVGDGVFYTPTIQAMLGYHRSAELRERMYRTSKKLVTIGSLLGGRVMSTLTWAPRTTNPWFSRALRGPLRARVFAFPHSGTAGAASYAKWLDIWPDSIELCALELPGRPSRLGEAPFSDFDTLAAAVADQLAPLCDVPFVVFGASLGAAMSYATVRRLGTLGVRPVAFMVAACTVPTFGIPQGQPSYRLPDAEFIAAIEQSYGGTMLSRLPPHVLGALLPGLRADFQMMEISTLPRQPAPVDCPLIAYAGIDDPMLPTAAVEAWSAWTSRSFRFEPLPRGHFFVTEERERLVRDIAAQLPA